jgi:hypothetical protein
MNKAGTCRPNIQQKRMPPAPNRVVKQIAARQVVQQLGENPR